MTLRQYIIIMSVATLLCWLSWGFVLLNVDPFKDNGMGFLFFYITLFFSLVGTVSLIGFGIVQWVSTQYRPMYRHVQLSFLVGVLLSLILILLLFLQGKAMLNILNIGIFAGSLVFILLFKLSLRLSNR